MNAKSDPRSWDVFLLTGVPAVGKTSLAKKLSELIRPLQIISFGEMILAARADDNPGISHSELRRNPTSEAPMDTIKRSTELLISTLDELRTHTNVVIDSHAVAKDHYGFRVSPDSTAFLARLGLRAVFVLHANYDEISRRVKTDGVGRRAVTRVEIETHERLQDAVAISYGVATGCPVFIVNTRTLDQTTEDLILLLNSLKVSYSRT
jgi:adenylate kinase